jgi:hypothetical protein
MVLFSLVPALALGVLMIALLTCRPVREFLFDVLASLGGPQL